MRIDLIDRPLHGIFLELEELFPNLRFNDLRVIEQQAAFLLISQKLLKDVIERLEVDKFWRVVGIQLSKVEQHLIFDVFDSAQRCSRSRRTTP